MDFNKTIYSVYLDGFFVGLTNNEDECWEIAEEDTYGTKDILHHDEVDRVWWHKINVNRFENDSTYIIKDKQQEFNNKICCNRYEAEKLCEKMNKINLEKEKLEAKLRALNL